MNIHKLEGQAAAFEMVPRDVVNDLACTDLCALGLWAYLLCKPSGWEIHPEQVCAALGLGRSRYYKTMKILKSKRLAKTVVTAINGKMAGHMVNIYALPHSINKLKRETQPADIADDRDPPLTDYCNSRVCNAQTLTATDPGIHRPCTANTHIDKRGLKDTEEEKDKREIYIGDLPDFDSGNPPGDKSARRQSSQPESQLSLLPDADSGKPKAKTSPSEYTEEFEAFWEGYPHRAGKGDASKIWKKLKDDQKAAIKAHLALNPYAGREKQHIPHGSTYLSKKKWEDEVITTNQRTRSMFG